MTVYEPVTTEDMTINRRTRVIVCFGPATPMTGMRAGEYFQVVIDPALQSEGGDYIRFDQRNGDENEIHGWQRIAALTVCEVLAELGEDTTGASVTMRAVTKEQ